MLVDEYLKELQNSSPDESMFPMDSPHTGKKSRKIIYGEKTDLAEERARIMIDFDGVIHKYTGWNDGKLNKETIPGAKEAIDTLRERYEIVIFTTRASESSNSPEKIKMLLTDLKKWLTDHEIYYDQITSEKLGAIAYIDDRGIRFKGNWTETLETVRMIESSE